MQSRLAGRNGESGSQVNILFLSWNFPPALGGIEDVAAHLVDGFQQRAQHVHLLTAGKAANRNTTNSDLEPPHIERAPKPGLKACLWNAWRRGRKHLRDGDFDLIVCPSIPTALPAYLLARKFKVPWVLLMHGTDIKKEGWLYQRVVRFLMKRATLVAAASENTARLCREAGADPARVVPIHPGVDPAKWQLPETELQDAARLHSGRHVMISVGRLIRRKGILEFVRDCMPQIAREEPSVLYLIVGDDATQSLAHKEPMRARIESEIVAKGLQEHVKLLGKVPLPELVRLLHRAEVFLLPGLDLPDDAEGFGIVFSEAALCGTPSIATRVGGMPEAVADGVSGLLVSPNDPAALTEAVLRLLRDPALLGQLRDDGRERAIQEFAWPVVLDRYQALFEQALENK